MENAKARGEKEKTYHANVCAGEVSAQEAWEHLKEDKTAVLLDVRTQPEWMFVGEPDLSSINKTLLKVSWRVYPSYAYNPDFIQAVKAVVPHNDTPIYLICRSGGRSKEAADALAQEGFSRCYNVLDGFEGDVGTSHHRGENSGWKAAKLPWGQV